jgi:hypothetical protein
MSVERQPIIPLTPGDGWDEDKSIRLDIRAILYKHPIDRDL